MLSLYQRISFIVFVTAISISPASAVNDDEIAKMQAKLNAQVMERPFSVADEKKIDAFIKSAMAKDLKPSKKVPSFWKPGYTCASIYHHGWNHYRNCRYYRRYYGRYW